MSISTPQPERDLEWDQVSGLMRRLDCANEVAMGIELIGPSDIKELQEVAEILRDLVEPQVHTPLQRDLVIRPDRDVDKFKFLKPMFELELAFAYLIIARSGRDSDAYGAQSISLSETSAQDINKSPNQTAVLRRLGDINYFDAMWTRQDGKPENPDLLKQAKDCYGEALKIVRGTKSILSALPLPNWDEFRQEMIAGGMGGFLDRMPDEQKVCEDAGKQLLKSLSGDQEEAVILLCLARVYALSGDRKSLAETLGEIKLNDPSDAFLSAVKQSADLIKVDAEQQPPPPAAVEMARAIGRKYDKNPRIVMP